MGCTAAPADCLGEKSRGLCLCARMLLLNYGANKGEASCQHKRKRFPGLVMGLCRAAKPIGVWLNPNNLEGWWQNPRRAEGHMHILNSSKYANVLCWLKLREIGFESNLFALSFTREAMHLSSHQATVHLQGTSIDLCGWRYRWATACAKEPKWRCKAAPI